MILTFQNAGNRRYQEDILVIHKTLSIRSGMKKSVVLLESIDSDGAAILL